MGVITVKVLEDVYFYSVEEAPRLFISSGGLSSGEVLLLKNVIFKTNVDLAERVVKNPNTADVVDLLSWV